MLTVMIIAAMAQAATLMGPAEPGKPERWAPIEGSRPGISNCRGGRVPVYPGLYVTYGPGKDQDADMAIAQIAASRELGRPGFRPLRDGGPDSKGGLLPLLRLGLTSR